MIRVFNAFCKSFFHNHSDLSIFHKTIDDFDVSKAICPLCNAKYNCADFSTYTRNMISYEKGFVTCHSLSIPRLICASCNHTHAVLPDILIPFGSYSLTFILKVLRAKFLGGKTVLALCEYFQISVSTLYSWIKLFHNQKQVWLGILVDATYPPLSFIEDLLNLNLRVSSFFNITQGSFLQPYRTTHLSSA